MGDRLGAGKPSLVIPPLIGTMSTRQLESKHAHHVTHYSSCPRSRSFSWFLAEDWLNGDSDDVQEAVAYFRHVLPGSVLYRFTGLPYI